MILVLPHFFDLNGFFNNSGNARSTVILPVHHIIQENQKLTVKNSVILQELTISQESFLLLSLQIFSDI